MISETAYAITGEWGGDSSFPSFLTKRRKLRISNRVAGGFSPPELNFLQRKPSAGIILFRIDEQNVRVKITILKNMLLRYPEKFHNHFVVIARKRIRLIPLEKTP